MLKKRTRHRGLWGGIAVLVVLAAAFLVVKSPLLQKVRQKQILERDFQGDFSYTRAYWEEIQQEYAQAPVQTATITDLSQLRSRYGFNMPRIWFTNKTLFHTIDPTSSQADTSGMLYSLMKEQHIQATEEDLVVINAHYLYVDIPALNGEPFLVFETYSSCLVTFLPRVEELTQPITFRWVDGEDGTHYLLDVDCPDMVPYYKKVWVDFYYKKYSIVPPIDELHLGLKGVPGEPKDPKLDDNRWALLSEWEADNQNSK